MNKISSPCTKVCTMDPNSGFCMGCGRTIQEIGLWSSFSEDERNKIILELPMRMEGLV
ncbi:MAG: DUF1289 domain-containing protein [Leptospiraceae bacterium]|nr:DUF1289 domain-containing protein [Leptospiraceae bacterium]